MIRKLFITPWFGPLPAWMEEYWLSAERLKQYGYDWLFTTDLDDFKRRVQTKLGIDCPIVAGSAKLHDYRPALGLLYADEIRGYDYWGHTDFDCIYGNPQHFVSDEFLADTDIHADWHAICGPWTLFRTNCAGLATAFMEYPEWRGILCEPRSTGWAETQFTEIVDRGHWTVQYTAWQGQHPFNDSKLRLHGDCLYDGEEEILMFHFRHLKRWPPQLTRCLIR